MKSPHESHSFGHGDDCFYCGLHDEDPEIESPCDQRVRKHPTEEEMAAYRARTKLGEEIAAIAEIEYGLAQSLEWDEMIARISWARTPENVAIYNEGYSTGDREGCERKAASDALTKRAAQRPNEARGTSALFQILTEQRTDKVQVQAEHGSTIRRAQKAWYELLNSLADLPEHHKTTFYRQRVLAMIDAMKAIRVADLAEQRVDPPSDGRHLRAREAGWVRIGRTDDSGRRSLWARASEGRVELCSGREGDDGYACVDAGSPLYQAIAGVVTDAIFMAVGP